MLRNVFVPIFGKIQGLEFVANVIKMISWTPRTIKLWDFVGYCGIEKAIILIYAFNSTVFYATSINERRISVENVSMFFLFPN